jgi:glycosyltransferase involved in cell wall biosynthesis
MQKQRIAFFLPTLDGGGAERVVLNLLEGMVKLDIPVDLVVASAEGAYLHQVPDRVRLIDLAAGRVVKAILPLSRYLKETNPIGLVSNMRHANVAAIVAKSLSGIDTKLVVVDHETLSASRSNLLRNKFILPMMKLLYPHADTIVGVSQGVATDLDTRMGFKPGRVKVIYNPVVDRQLISKSQTTLEHPWFHTGSPPVFLGVGRLSEQKDFLNLINAFALLRQKRPARLIILGEGESRSELEAAIATLNISADVSLPGFVDNPYAYMACASAFILSSRWEGLPTVLIEAMACGCPVVATDCPSGPDEILGSGKYGDLVPVEDAPALSRAMERVLDLPASRESLVARGTYFSTERAVAKYLDLFDYPIAVESLPVMNQNKV